MPITRKQFDLGITSGIEELMIRAHEHITQKRDEAFSQDDLMFLIEPGHGMFHTGKMENLKAALRKLVELGTIESRIISNVEYYSYMSKLDI